MSKKTTAEYLGLTVSFEACEADDVDHPQVQYEDELAQLYIKFACTMCGKRMVRKLPALRGWTGRSLLFLNEARRDDAIDMLHKDWGN